MPLISTLQTVQQTWNALKKSIKYATVTWNSLQSGKRVCWRVKFGPRPLHYDTEFLCRGQGGSVSGLCILLTTLQSVVLTDESSLTQPFSFFLFFRMFHVVVLGPGAFSLKQATLKEPPNAAQHRVGVMREMVVFAARLCGLRDGQRCRLRYKHSCCSFNELRLTASRCIGGRNTMGYRRPRITQNPPNSILLGRYCMNNRRILCGGLCQPRYLLDQMCLGGDDNCCHACCCKKE